MAVAQGAAQPVKAQREMAPGTRDAHPEFMRFFLVVGLAAVLAGCMTVDGPRRYADEKHVGTRCEPGNPSVMIDESVRDRVRLVFSQSDLCTEVWEAGYEKEQRTKLTPEARGVLSAGAGLIVAVPLVVLVLAASQEDDGIVANPLLDATQPATRRWGTHSVGEPAFYGVLAVSTAAALGANEAMKTSDRAPSVKGVERREQLKVYERVVTTGVVQAPGLEVHGLRLSNGVLDLPLEEALGLADGELYLDGVRVVLKGDARERLGFLTVCQQALDAVAHDFDAWVEPPGAKAWKLADACDRRGWTFAESVRLRR